MSNVKVTAWRLKAKGGKSVANGRSGHVKGSKVTPKIIFFKVGPPGQE